MYIEDLRKWNWYVPSESQVQICPPNRGNSSYHEMDIALCYLTLYLRADPRKNLYKRHDSKKNVGYRLGHRYGFMYFPPESEPEFLPLLQWHTYDDCDFTDWSKHDRGDEAHFGIYQGRRFLLG